ncbi:MAG TPA: tRNA preQ1(34) S-adenosylmethionine ribosyltransferase-isomerase QueA [Myxococcales bacterium]|nr:tRNA preQ1(34) S-adenosylmethionine ribosyltransferase-isomerase QueA [Myxococcales bacterium]
MDVAAFDYDLPEDLIAKTPLPERDASRLLVLPRREGAAVHSSVRDLPGLLRPGDLLVVNDAKVIPARLRGRKEGTGGKVELLLVEPVGGTEWLALGNASKPLRPGAFVEAHGARIEILAEREGELRIRLPLQGDDLFRYLDEAGETPLPPYIDRPPDPADRERYQTIFARERGAVAAPTAGLHFTEALVAALRQKGIALAPITLYVGPGTFLPVRTSRVEDHRMHRERYAVPRETAEAWSRTRAQGGRVVAVGTTALRTLEAASDGESLREGPGATDLFVTPGYRFKGVDALFTNFHLPRSTLLMLVAAFAGLDRILAAYREAVSRRYRFFSYGDAMLIV